MAFIFWGLVAFVGLIIWGWTLSAFLTSRLSKSRTLRWLGAAPFLLCSLIGGFFAIAMASTFIASDNPKTIFAQEFGFAPPSDVKNLNSSYYWFGDSGLIYLKFQAAPATIKRITGKKFALLNTSQTAQEKSGFPINFSSDIPAWWNPQPASGLQIWKGPNSDSFSTETTRLYYDKKTRWAHYSFEGGD